MQSYLANRSTNMLSESPLGFFVEMTIVKKIKQLLFCDVTKGAGSRGGSCTIPSLSADMSGIGIVSMVTGRDLHVAQLDLALTWQEGSWVWLPV